MQCARSTPPTSPTNSACSNAGITFPQGSRWQKLSNSIQVFKTLVTVGKTGEHYVFMIPVAEELDLKKAARAVGEKSIAMIKSKELLPLTGYVHGGCSPIGMKKTFTTVVDETAQLFDAIYFSAGKIGCQIRLSSEDLGKVIDLSYADLIA